MRRTLVGVAAAGAIIAFGSHAWAARPDPTAEPGLRTATTLLLETNAALAPPLGESPDGDDALGAGTGEVPSRVPNADSVPRDESVQKAATASAAQRADRAATVSRIWFGRSAQSLRLAEVQDQPIEVRQVRFVATEWRQVSAWADRGTVVVIGRIERRAFGEVWRADPDQIWRIELYRGDPVGRQRGWKLAQMNLDAWHPTSEPTTTG